MWQCSVYFGADGSETHAFGCAPPKVRRVKIDQRKDQTQVGFFETVAEQLRRYERSGQCPRVVEMEIGQSQDVMTNVVPVLSVIVEILDNDPS